MKGAGRVRTGRAERASFAAVADEISRGGWLAVGRQGRSRSARGRAALGCGARFCEAARAAACQADGRRRSCAPQKPLLTAGEPAVIAAAKA
jgi:hypothetical protein